VATGSAINWLYSLNQPSAQQNISAQFGTPNPFNVNGAPYLLNVGYQAVQFHGIVPLRTMMDSVPVDRDRSDRRYRPS
jgi:hypothetical protein